MYRQTTSMVYTISEVAGNVEADIKSEKPFYGRVSFPFELILRGNFLFVPRNLKSDEESTMYQHYQFNFIA